MNKCSEIKVETCLTSRYIELPPYVFNCKLSEQLVSRLGYFEYLKWKNLWFISIPLSKILKLASPGIYNIIT